MDIVIILLAGILQLLVFIYSFRNILLLKKVFHTSKITILHDENIIVEEFSPIDFRELDPDIKSPIYNYLKQNDFKISNYDYIKDIIENFSDSIENKINSTISIPLFLGLISTMVCIAIGLWQISAQIHNTNEVNWIDILFTTVKIPMIASAWGLILTIINTGIFYRWAKTINDKNKTLFYSYIQENYIVRVPQTIDKVIETFTDKFNKFTNIVDQFDESLKGITDSFSNVFRDNINYFNNSFKPTIEQFNNVLKEITTSFSTDVKETVNKQYEIITKVESIKVTELTNANLEIFKSIEKSSLNLEKFSSYIQKLDIYIDKTEALINNSNNLILLSDKTYNRFNSFGNNIEEITSTISHNLELAAKIEDFFNSNIDYLRNQTQFVQNTHTEIIAALSSYTNKIVEEFKFLILNYNNQIINILSQFKETLEKRPEIIWKIEQLEKLNNSISSIPSSNQSLIDSIKNLMELIEKLNKKTPEEYHDKIPNANDIPSEHPLDKTKINEQKDKVSKKVNYNEIWDTSKGNRNIKFLKRVGNWLFKNRAGI